MNAPARDLDRAAHYQRLKHHAAGGILSDLLARMLASQAVGQGSMPAALGLPAHRFQSLFTEAFPHRDPDLYSSPQPPGARGDEVEELVELFLEHASGPAGESAAVAEILATGCMGNDHLWQDLGLWSRDDLSLLIRTWFPALAAKNVRDMKWKRFFYKQLCEREGVYTCRAPSCAECTDYAVCFGPE